MANRSDAALKAWRGLTRTLAFKFPAETARMERASSRMRRLTPPAWRGRRGGR